MRFLLAVFVLFSSYTSAQQDESFYSYQGKEVKIKTLINPRKSGGQYHSDEWTVVTKYSNGQIKRQGSYYRGLWNGEWKRYSKEGNLIFEGKFDMGYQEGVHKYYYYSGKIKHLTFFHEGKAEGNNYFFSENGDTTEIDRYRNNNIIKSIHIFKDYTLEQDYISNKPNGVFIKRNRARIILEKGNYSNGLKTGEWTCYDSLGNKIFSYTFLNTDTTKDKQKYSICNVNSDAIDSNHVFTVAEKMPEFPGGNAELFKFIQNEIQYPSFCKANEMQGRKSISFEVSENGDIEYIIPLGKELFSELTEEAIRVIELLPKFKPGMQQGKNVRVRYVLPILFKLE